VLSTPPAFVLSQDQTLQQKLGKPKPSNSKKIAREKNYSWHWLIKHPVEFSKNNHTPSPRLRLETRPWGNRSNLPGRLRLYKTGLGDLRLKASPK
jgi:hypothetical protein